MGLTHVAQPRISLTLFSLAKFSIERIRCCVHSEVLVRIARSPFTIPVPRGRLTPIERYKGLPKGLRPRRVIAIRSGPVAGAVCRPPLERSVPPAHNRARTKDEMKYSQSLCRFQGESEAALLSLHAAVIFVLRRGGTRPVAAVSAGRILLSLRGVLEFRRQGRLFSKPPKLPVPKGTMISPPQFGSFGEATLLSLQEVRTRRSASLPICGKEKTSDTRHATCTRLPSSQLLSLSASQLFSWREASPRFSAGA